MKKKISFLLLVLATIFTGCSKDELSNEPVAFKEGQKVTITASVNDNATRATSEYNSGTSKIDFKWSAGDVLTVTVGGKSTTFTMKEVPGEGAGYSTATFEGTMPASGTTFDASFGSSTIPTSQTYSSTSAIASNAMYFTATNCTLNGSLNLVPQMAVLNLKLYGPATTTIGKIVVTKGGTAYTLDCSNGGAGITLPETEVAAQKFFMVIPAGNETFTVRVYDNASTPSEICSFSKTSTAAVTAGSFLVMPAKEVKTPAGICFTALEANSTVSMKNSYNTPKLMKSTDGINFTDWDYSAVTLANVGDKLYVKANATGNKTINKQFAGTGNLKVSGNIMTLLNADSPATTMTSDNYACFYNLFSGMPISDISGLKLPATTLASSCYYTMFSNCTLLTEIPSGLLPATSLAENCYYGMFSSCSSLQTIPANLLPAPTLTNSCYYSMFYNCTSLTTVPTNLLPANTLAPSCYYQMFSSCSKLESAPNLPAENLASRCCQSMFNGCESLKTAPENLPATTLKEKCYLAMFANCKSLTTAPVLSAATLETECYNSMFSGCSKLSSVTMLATSVTADNALKEWLNNAGTSASSRTVYVATGMVDAVKATVPNNWKDGVQVKP